MKHLVGIGVLIAMALMRDPGVSQPLDLTFKFTTPIG
jgi:hypothetical protein